MSHTSKVPFVSQSGNVVATDIEGAVEELSLKGLDETLAVNAGTHRAMWQASATWNAPAHTEMLPFNLREDLSNWSFGSATNTPNVWGRTITAPGSYTVITNGATIVTVDSASNINVGDIITGTLPATWVGTVIHIEGLSLWIDALTGTIAVNDSFTTTSGGASIINAITGTSDQIDFGSGVNLITSGVALVGQTTDVLFSMIFVRNDQAGGGTFFLLKVVSGPTNNKATLGALFSPTSHVDPSVTLADAVIFSIIVSVSTSATDFTYSVVVGPTSLPPAAAQYLSNDGGHLQAVSVAVNQSKGILDEAVGRLEQKNTTLDIPVNSLLQYGLGGHFLLNNKVTPKASLAPGEFELSDGRFRFAVASGENEIIETCRPTVRITSADDISIDDMGKIVVIATSGTYQLPLSNTGASTILKIKNNSGGAVTLSGILNGVTIDGASSRALADKEYVELFSTSTIIWLAK